MNLSEKAIHRIRRHRKQPEYGKLLKTLQNQFRIVLFTQEIYEVGRGGFGRCCLGKFQGQHSAKDKKPTKEGKEHSFEAMTEDQKVVVVKIIPKNKSLPNDDVYIRQIDNLSSVRSGKTDQECKNIVKIYPFKIISDNNYYLVMQYCYHSTLAELIETRKKRGKRFNLGELLTIMQDMLNGYGLLRSKKIIHNDIKPHNIFIKDRIFKLGDFGISVKLSENDKEFIPINCTYPYSPIEKIEKKSINHKADIYALGLVFAEILFGQHPYFDETEWKHYYCLKLEEQRLQKENENIIQLGVDQFCENPEGIIQRNRRQSDKKRNIFISYLKQKSNKPVFRPTAISYETEDAEIVEEIRKVVIMMCGKEESRPTYENVRVLLSNIKNLNLASLKYEKFEDLKYLRGSQLCYNIENLPKSSYSLISNMRLNESKKREKFSILTYEKLLCLKSRLSETANFVNLCYLITSNLNTSQQSDTIDIQLLKLEIYQYLYWVNHNELREVTNAIASLKEDELEELYAMNMEKIMRNSRIDSDKLAELVFVEMEGDRLKEARKRLSLWLQRKYLDNIIISEENYQQYYLFFIISDLIKCEEKYSGKEDKRPMGQQMEKICSQLTQLEKQTIPYHFFQEKEKSYVIFYK